MLRLVLLCFQDAPHSTGFIELFVDLTSVHLSQYPFSNVKDIRMVGMRMEGKSDDAIVRYGSPYVRRIHIQILSPLRSDM